MKIRNSSFRHAIRLTLLLLLAQMHPSLRGLAQTPWVCGNPDTAYEERYLVCGSPSDPFYIQYNNQAHTWYNVVSGLTPVKNVHVSFVVWHRNDGTGGWPNTALYSNVLAQHLQFVSDSIYGKNAVATHLPVPGTPHIPDTRVRFVLDNIYHMYNTSLYESSQSPTSYNAPLYATYPDAKKSMNIHIIQGDAIYLASAWGWATGTSPNLSADAGVVTKQATPFTGLVHSWAGHLAHELGHNLGLGHTYGGWGGGIYYPGGESCEFTGTDFLTDVYGTTPDSCVLGAPGCTPCYSICDVCPHAGGATNNVMGAGASMNFSPLQIGRMHRVLQGRNVRKYTWGYGSTPYTIPQNETWNFNVKVYQDLVIPYGKRLIIKCRVEMVPDARITVQPGGVLEVDGGVITAPMYAGGPWQGIEVIGNASLPQNPGAGGVYPQGRLILKNNAVIENARNAVTTWKFNDWNTMGGMITASDATFRNNNRSVEFISYAHPEKSSFKNCKFIVDGPLLEGYCASMVTAWGINGVDFQGCEFEVTPAGLSPAYPAPKGIYTINTQFKVGPSCNSGPPPVFPCPLASMKPSKFKGLLYGIEATNGGSYNFVVDSTLFENCAVGVKTSAVNLFEVIRSSFDIKPYTGIVSPTGLSNDAGTGFKIQNNRFYSTQANPLSYQFIGLFNNNTGTALNEVYRNTYQNMYRANNSSMINWGDGANASLGLKYKCNTQSGNRRDIQVSDGTIGQVQGAVAATNVPAANTFSVTTDLQGHIANNGTNFMLYIYGPGAGQQPTLYTTSNVIPITTTATDLCPSRLIWGGLTGEIGRFQAAKKAWDEASLRYAQMLKGESTGKVSKSDLEGLMALHAAEWNRSADELIRHYLTDPADAHPDSARAWINRKGDLASQLILSDREAASLDYAASIARLQALETAGTALAPEIKRELKARIICQELLHGFRGAGNEYWNLDKAQQMQLYNFAAAGRTAAHNQAKNILSFFYDYSFKDEMRPGDDLQAGSATSKTMAGPARSASLLKVHPNPASDRCAFEYDLPETMAGQRLVLTLTALDGRRVHQTTLNGHRGTFNMDVSALAPGTYIYSLSANGGKLESGSLIVR